MKDLFTRARRFFNIQYRITFRAVLNGLLAGCRDKEMDRHALISHAHALTVLALQQYQKSEI